MDIADKVKGIISKNLDVPVESIRNESRFIEDLQADSLAIVELVLAFEEEFDIEIPDEVTEKIRTVQDTVDYIQAHAVAR